MKFDYEKNLLLQQIGVFKHDMVTLQARLNDLAKCNQSAVKPSALADADDTEEAYVVLRRQIDSLNETNIELLSRIEETELTLSKRDMEAVEFARVLGELSSATNDAAEEKANREARVAYLEKQYVNIEAENIALSKHKRDLQATMVSIEAIHSEECAAFRARESALNSWKTEYEAIALDKDRQLDQLKSFYDMSVQLESVQIKLIDATKEIKLKGMNWVLF